MYRTVKNIGGEKTLVNLANYSTSPSFFANVHKFYYIPYANGLQFTKIFSTKFPTVLIHQTFFTAKGFFTVRYEDFYCNHEQDNVLQADH